MQLILFSFCATLLMTFFSYLCGKITGNQFSEAKLLGRLIRSGNSGKTGPWKLAGWIVHLAIGVIFGILLKWALNLIKPEDLLVYSIIGGVLAGILGVLGWETMFRFHSNPPKVNLKKFYTQLIIAHIIFSLVFIGLYSRNIY